MTANFVVMAKPEFDRVAQDVFVEDTLDEAFIQGEFQNFLETMGGAKLSNRGQIAWSYDVHQSQYNPSKCPRKTPVTFSATDSCNTLLQTYGNFVVQDTTPPVLVAPAVDVTVEADGHGNVQALEQYIIHHGSAKAFDNMAATDLLWEASPVRYKTSGNVYGCNDKYAVITFTASDRCGNSVTTKGRFVIEDTTGPTFVQQPQDVLVSAKPGGNLAEYNQWIESYGNSQAMDLGTSGAYCSYDGYDDDDDGDDDDGDDDDGDDDDTFVYGTTAAPGTDYVGGQTGMGMGQTGMGGTGMGGTSAAQGSHSSTACGHCNNFYMPCCTLNGKTEYQNPCYAYCAKIYNFQHGPCAGPHNKVSNASVETATGDADDADGITQVIFQTGDECTGYCDADTVEKVCALHENGLLFEFQTSCHAHCFGFDDYDKHACVIDVGTYTDGAERVDTAGKLTTDFVAEARKEHILYGSVCYCSSTYAPVCSGGGTEYINNCRANCAGVDKYTSGPCPIEGASAAYECGELSLSYSTRGVSGTCPETHKVKFVATDTCGNMVSSTKNFEVMDQTNPQVITPASSATATSYGRFDSNHPDFVAWLQNKGGATFSDFVDDSLSYSHGKIVWIPTDTDGSNPYCKSVQTVVTFKATDDCSNTGSTTAAFTVVDTEAPQVVTSAQDISIQFDGESSTLNKLSNWLDNHGGAQVWDRVQHRNNPECPRPQGVSVESYRVSDGAFDCGLCSDSMAPVCAGGEEFDNACFARCNGKSDCIPGQCAGAVATDCSTCSVQFDPVCADGVQYENSCLAYCKGVREFSPGTCESPIEVEGDDQCSCNGEYMPVCADGVEYQNLCMLHCKTNGDLCQGTVPQYVEGPCSYEFQGRSQDSCDRGFLWFYSPSKSELWNELRKSNGCESQVKVTFTVVDGCGNRARTNAKVFMTDGSAPVITTPPKHLIVSCDSRCQDLSTGLRVAEPESVEDDLLDESQMRTSDACNVCGSSDGSKAKITSLTFLFKGANGGTNSQPDSKYSVTGDPANYPGQIFTITNSMNSLETNIQAGSEFTLSILEGAYREAYIEQEELRLDLEASFRQIQVTDDGELLLDEYNASDRKGNTGKSGGTSGGRSGGTTGKTGKTAGTAGAGNGYKFPAEICVFISIGTQLISTVSFHSSCSYPILEGEQFGSLVLSGFINSAGQSDTYCTPYNQISSYYGGGTGKTGNTGKTSKTGKSSGSTGKTSGTTTKNYGYSYAALDTQSTSLGYALTGAKDEFAQWIRTAGCAVANDDLSQIVWSSNFNPNSLNNVFCGQSGSVIFTATDACGKKTDVPGTYEIRDSNARSCDACANLPDVSDENGPCNVCSSSDGVKAKITSLSFTFTGFNGGSNSQPASKYFVTGDPANYQGSTFTITNSINKVVQTVKAGDSITIGVEQGEYRMSFEEEARVAIDDALDRLAEGRVTEDGEIATDEFADVYSEENFNTSDRKGGTGKSGKSGKTGKAQHDGKTGSHEGYKFKFPSQMEIYICVGNKVVSVISFHSSCSYPILQGEQFGSFRLDGFENSAGSNENYCTPYSAQQVYNSKPKLEQVRLRWRSAAGRTGPTTIQVSATDGVPVFANTNLQAVVDMQEFTLSPCLAMARKGSTPKASNGYTMTNPYGTSNTYTTLSDACAFPSSLFIHVNGVYYDAHTSCSVPIAVGSIWAQSQYGYLEVVGFQRTDGKTDNNCFGGADPHCDSAYECSNLQTYTEKGNSNTYEPPPPTAPYQPPTFPPTPRPTPKPTTLAPTTKAPVSPPTAACVDEYNDVRQCELWKQQGFCVANSAYSAFMKGKCAKTCQYCDSAGGSPQPVPTPKPTPRPTPRPTPKPTPPFSEYRSPECTSENVCEAGEKPTTITLTYVGYNPNTGSLTRCQRCKQGVITEYCSNCPQDVSETIQSAVAVKEPGPNGKPRMNIKLVPKRKININDYIDDKSTVNKINVGDSFTLRAGGPENVKLPATVNIKVGRWKIRFKVNCKEPLFVGDQFGSLMVTGYTAEGTDDQGNAVQHFCNQNWQDVFGQ